MEERKRSYSSNGRHNRNNVRSKDRATRRVGQVSRNKRTNPNRGWILFISAIVVIFSVVMVTGIVKQMDTLSKLKEEEALLQAQHNELLKVYDDLKEKEVYVHTNAYVEEEARKLGLVYPDEVIFKPEDD